MGKCCCCNNQGGNGGGTGGGTGGGGTGGGGTGGGGTGGGGTGGGGGKGGGGGGAGGGPWPVPPLGSWLLLRFDAADLGARPVPNGDVWWESPDIWLTGGDALGNAIGGQPATLFARVWNLGSLAASPVRVDFSFIAPSLGIPPSAPKLIGTAWTNVPALRARVVTCPVPWIPPTDLQDVHACLVVTCSAPLQGDVPSQPGNAVADRHTAQHNLTIVEAQAGQSLNFTVTVANLAPLAKTVDLMAAAVWRTTPDLNLDEFQLTPSVQASLSAINRPSTVDDTRLWSRRASILAASPHGKHLVHVAKSAVLDAVRVAQVGHRRKARGAVAVVDPPFRASAPTTAFTPLGHALELEPQQCATVHLEVTVPSGGGHPWFLAHIAQASDGMLTGGYTIAMKVL
jgi:hypothetical protein